MKRCRAFIFACCKVMFCVALTTSLQADDPMGPLVTKISGHLKSVPDLKFSYVYRIRETDEQVFRVPIEFCKFGAKFYIKKFTDDSKQEIKDMVSFDGKTYFAIDRDKRLKIASNYNDVEADWNAALILNPIFNPYHRLLMKDMDSMDYPLFADVKGWMQSVGKTRITALPSSAGVSLLRQQFDSDQIEQDIQFNNARPYPFRIAAKTTWEALRKEYRDRDVAIQWVVEKDFEIKGPGGSFWIPSQISHRIRSLHGEDKGEMPGAYDISLDERSVQLLDREPPIREFQIPRSIAEYVYDADLQIGLSTKR